MTVSVTESALVSDDGVQPDGLCEPDHILGCAVLATIAVGVEVFGTTRAELEDGSGG